MFHILDLFQYAPFALSPDGPLFRPARRDVHKIDGIDVHPCSRISAVSNRISFEKTGTGFVPLIGGDGYLFSQERPRFGGRSPTSLVVGANRCEEPVDRGRGYPLQGLDDFYGKGFEVPGIAGEPEGQDCFQPF